VRKEGRAGGIPVRNWTNEGPAKPGDFAPAVSPERSAAQGRHLEELEARVLLSGRPAVGSGSETEASMMFGGTGTSGNEQIPPWIRDMIRKKVREYLPDLEAAYTDAIRRNPALKGKMIVRFRIDPSGKVPFAVSMESAFADRDFMAVVLEKIRHWTFDPPAGQTVEVLYPFVFVAPS
jgi:outer membrane biosynthesis protein TonB